MPSSRFLPLAFLVSLLLHGLLALFWVAPRPISAVQTLIQASLRTLVPLVEAPPAPAVMPSPRVEKSEPAKPRLAHVQPTNDLPAPRPATPPAVAMALPESVPPSAANPTASAAPGPAVPALAPPRYDAAYLANPPPEYPGLARRRGIEGTVLLEARIDVHGVAREVRVTRSGGHDSLDNAAREAVLGWRFIPARRGDQAVEAWVSIPMTFRLN